MREQLEAVPDWSGQAYPVSHLPLALGALSSSRVERALSTSPAAAIETERQGRIELTDKGWLGLVECCVWGPIE